MSLLEPFGVGNLYLPDPGGIRPVEDRIVPNGLLADTQALRERAKAHPTVPEFLKLRGYERRELLFARTPDCFRRPIEASFHDGDTVMACEASYEGVSHFFLGQPFRRFLRTRGLSVVRDYGTSAGPVINTQTTPYELPPDVSKQTPLARAFWGDVPYPPKIATDFVAPAANLVVYLDAFGEKIVGATHEASPIREFFGPPKKGVPGWGDELDWEIRGDPPLVASLPPSPGKEGWKVFPTREGFRHLRDQGLAIIRATRFGPDGPWDDFGEGAYWP